mgnify:CR=1 FL=1
MSVSVRLRKLLEEIVETEKASPDPFKINVRRLLDELSLLLPMIKDEDLELDSEILSRLADVVLRQEEWVRERSTTLLIGQLIALLKLRTMDKIDLTLELLNAWNPIVELEQVTLALLIRSLEYLRDRRLYRLPEASEGEARRLSLKDLVSMQMISNGSLEKALRTVMERIMHAFRRIERIDYYDVVRGKNCFETYLNAYALACLASEGKVSITYDPLEDKYYVVRPGDDQAYYSIIVLLRLNEYAE